MTEELHVPERIRKRCERELLRVFIEKVTGDQIVVLSNDPEAGDPGVWGIRLADVARHVAKSLVRMGLATAPKDDPTNLQLVPEDVIFRRIVRSLMIELQEPTTDVEDITRDPD